MVNWLSRTSLTLILAAAAGCHNSDNFRIVSAQGYKSPVCWTDSEGDFASLLTFSDNGASVVPYLISAKCLIDGEYSNDGESILLNINTVRVIEPSRAFQHAFPDKALSNPTRSDQPLPSSASKIYYIKARGGYKKDGQRVIFQPAVVVRVRDMGMTFDRFLGLSRGSRA